MPSKKSRTITRWVRRNQNKHLCGCGCGEFIEIKRSHYKKSVGIPKFRRGHNLQLSEEKVKEVVEEKNSVWSNLSEEERERRLSNLKSFGKREENPAWKGGRRIDDNGYIQILMPDHPFANDGYVAEHRLVVEERTRKEDPNNPLLVEVKGEKYLIPSCVVHHIDEVKTNNASENLMLLRNQSAHAFIHKSTLPMEERLRRIEMGIYHSGPIKGEDNE